MKLVSFGPRGHEKPGAVYGDKIIDLVAANPAIPSTVRKILDVGALPRIETVLKKASTLPAKCFRLTSSCLMPNRKTPKPANNRQKSKYSVMLHSVP